MVDIKKLKKVMIDKDVSQVVLIAVLEFKSRMSWHNRMNYVTPFTSLEIQLMAEYLKCKYEDITFETSEEYLEEIEKQRKASEFEEGLNAQY